MAPKKRGLGKGLDTLIPNKGTEKKQTIAETKTSVSKSNIRSNNKETKSPDSIVKISLIQPDPNQPRKTFTEESLQELSDSIKKFGIIQPIVVTASEDSKFYNIVAGERRWRAAKLAGLKEVPVIIREFDKLETIEISIIENIQRENLNPIEEAAAYQRLIDEYHFTQEDVASKVSKSRVSITNSLRLLKLNTKVQELVANGSLSYGHARAILGVSDSDKQFEIAQMVINTKLSVRETEKYISKLSASNDNPKSSSKSNAHTAYYKEMEEKMKEALGCKVSIDAKSPKRGKIVIEYYSQSDLELLYNFILSNSKK